MCFMVKVPLLHYPQFRKGAFEFVSQGGRVLAGGEDELDGLVDLVPAGLFGDKFDIEVFVQGLGALKAVLVGVDFPEL